MCALYSAFKNDFSFDVRTANITYITKERKGKNKIGAITHRARVREFTSLTAVGLWTRLPSPPAEVSIRREP